MISLADALKQKREEIKLVPFKSQRAELLSQLYEFYLKDYKRQSWKEYVAWLKKNHRKHSKETIGEYKKIMYPKISLKSFCSYWLGHIPTSDLFYLVSIAKDKENRRESFNKWLFWALKVDKSVA